MILPQTSMCSICIDREIARLNPDTERRRLQELRLTRQRLATEQARMGLATVRTEDGCPAVSRVWEPGAGVGQQG